MKFLFLWLCVTPIFAGDTIAVVELFTSQGCSSCPPADKVLMDLSDRPGVIALSFHVSYWNYLGWRDPYSNSEYDRRQRAYSRALNVQTYTPQMVVNGAQALVGSKRGEAEAAIEMAKMKPTIVTPVFDQLHLEGRRLHISWHYTGKSRGGDRINLALVRVNNENKVRAGENRGRNLMHTNVVHVFESVAATKERFVLTVPDDFNPSEFRLIAYVQGHDLRIVGATQAEIPGATEKN